MLRLYNIFDKFMCQLDGVVEAKDGGDLVNEVHAVPLVPTQIDR